MANAKELAEIVRLLREGIDQEGLKVLCGNESPPCSCAICSGTRELIDDYTKYNTPIWNR